MTEFEQPLISIDVVPLRFVKRDGKTAASLQVATAARIFEPYLGTQALPGVLLGAHETASEAAYRALAAKLGVDKSAVVRLTQFGVFDNSNRDPRGATLSIAFLAVIKPTAETNGVWHTVTNTHVSEATGLPSVIEATLPFDHNDIINQAKIWTATNLWSNAELTASLLDDEFATADAYALTTILRGEAQVDATNFNRFLRAYATQSGTAVGGRGRRSSSWRF